MKDMSTKEKIYQEAFTDFYNKGYGAVSLRNIAAVCEIRHNTVLYYYGSKDGLAQEIMLRLRQCAIREFGAFWSSYTAAHPDDDNLKYEMFTWRWIHLYLHVRDDRFASFSLEFSKLDGVYSKSTSSLNSLYVTKSLSTFLKTAFEPDYVKRALRFDISFDVFSTCAKYLSSGQMDPFECFWTYFSVYKQLLLPECSLLKSDAKRYFDTVLSQYNPDMKEVMKALQYDASLAEDAN